MTAELLARLKEERETVVHLQKELVARPAIGPENGGEGESDRAAWLEEELLRMGFKEIFSYPCPDSRVPSGVRPNLAVRIPGKSSRTLWVIGHMDVVPAGDLQLWNGNPFVLRVEGDLVYGRGVEDNQQAIVSALAAAKVLLETGATPDLSFGILMVSDEETGMTHGLPHVLETAPSLVAEDDLVLVPDMGNREGSMVEIAEKGCLWLKFTVLGAQCHASRPDNGVNSLVGASALVLELESLYRLFRDKDTLYSPAWSTFVPSKKEANVENINTMPGRDVFYLDCRLLPSVSFEDVLAECRRAASAVEERWKVTVEIEEIMRDAPPPPTSAESPVVVRLVESLRRLRGIEPKLCGAGGLTVAACLRRKNRQAAVWGTLMPNAHSPNECSRISATLDDAAVMLDMLFDTLS